MSIKVKNRDPKKTDFASDEIVINRKDGTLFFKSEKNLIKLSGDDLSTETVEGSSTSVWTLSGDNIFYLDGKVGIGTDSPSQKLHVKGSDHTAIQVDSSGGTDKNAFIKLTNDARSFSIKTIGSNNHLYIVDETAGTSPFKLTGGSPSDTLVLNNGNVGIGTDTPGEELTVHGNISASLTGSFGRIETLTISASTGDFDASTIRIGGESLNKSNLVALKEARSIQTTAKDLDEGDSSVTNLFRVEAVMSVDDDSTYIKTKGIGRMGTFISGSLFYDLQKSPTKNLARIGDGDTNLLFSGSIVSASINGGFF